MLSVIVNLLAMKLLLETADHLEISVRDLLVVKLDVIIFLRHFLGKFSNCRIFPFSNLLGLIFAVFLFLNTKHFHFVLVLLMNLIANALKVLSQLRLLLHLVSLERV